MRNKLVLGALTLSAAALLAGCFGHAGAYAEADAPVVFDEEPTLVVVDSDVWVVRDYDYAVYYVDGYYWVYRGDVWHRSRAYDRGWTTVEVTIVPRVIASRDHHAFVHFRGGPNAPTRKAPRDGGADHDRSRRADDRRDVPPGRDKDEAPRPPARSEDRHDAPPGRDGDKGPRPPAHSDDRDTPPRHDERPGVNPTDENQGQRDKVKRQDHEKKGDKKGDDRRKPNKDDQKRDGRDTR